LEVATSSAIASASPQLAAIQKDPKLSEPEPDAGQVPVQGSRWDKVYERLRIQNEDLMIEYENVLSRIGDTDNTMARTEKALVRPLHTINLERFDLIFDHRL
jgi:hypothetical protein